MLLEVVPLARDVGGNLQPVGEADASDFADSGVWLARGHRGHLGADATLKRGRVENRAVLERIKTPRQRGRLGFAL